MAKTIFDASRIQESMKAAAGDDPEKEEPVANLELEIFDAPRQLSQEPPMEESASKHHKTAQSERSHAHLPRRAPEEYSQVLRDESSSEGWIGSYVSQPRGMRFETQQEQEQILLVLRQHPIVFVPKVVTLIALLLLPFLVFPIFPFFVFLPPQMSFFAFIGWYLFAAIFSIESFLDWYYNIYVITDERIIDIDFYSLIYKSVSEAKINKIEDVTATTAGVLGSTFNYGTITIQTAAEKREFEFAKVPHPAKVTKLLNELILEEEREGIEGRVM